jgi:hypothetical protein
VGRRAEGRSLILNFNFGAKKDWQQPATPATSVLLAQLASTFL